MNNSDEPLFDQNDHKDRPDAESSLSVRQRILDLVNQQSYAVLCTQGGGQPYGSLVAFAFSDDLRHAVFVTPVATRKFRLLSDCKHVALVIDDRSNKPNELMQIEALTVTGRAALIERGTEFDRLADLLVKRHPYLKSFVTAASCALFRIDAVRFLHVAHFQEVSQWIPPVDC
jgi:nitroimidazol reductase NimA-like FMN-containing flavoprotein (pyridoxamine 5'-phosphate oxidase superfamily)